MLNKSQKTQRQEKFSRGWLYRRFSYIKLRSLKNGRDFLISFDDYCRVRQQDKCHYCGITPKYGSIDRKDNSLGYVKGNLVVACYECNQLKGAVLNEKQMLLVARLINRFRKETGNPNFHIIRQRNFGEKFTIS
jgi:hypothetical protein